MLVGMPWTSWICFMVMVSFGLAFQPQRYPDNMDFPSNFNQQQIQLSPSGAPPPPFIGNFPQGMFPQNGPPRFIDQRLLIQPEKKKDRIPGPIDMLFPGLFNNHEEVEWKDWMENSIPYGTCEAFIGGLSFLPGSMFSGVFANWALGQFCQEVLFRIVIPMMGKSMGHEYKDWIF